MLCVLGRGFAKGGGGFGLSDSPVVQTPRHKPGGPEPPGVWGVCAHASIRVWARTAHTGESHAGLKKGEGWGEAAWRTRHSRLRLMFRVSLAASPCTRLWASRSDPEHHKADASRART